MALIACPECGHKVSDAAAACPACGHPVRRTVAVAPGYQPGGGRQTVLAPPAPPPATSGGVRGGRRPNAPGTGAIRFLGVVALTVGGWMLCSYYLGSDARGEHTVVGWLVGAVGLLLLLAPNPVSKDSLIVCPHCQMRGRVRTRPVTRKKGIDGGKAMAALLTGGVSLLATGLSRMERQTEARCSNCGAVWHF